MKYYPIQKLNRRITEKFRKIVSSDIFDNIKSGLENDIELIDVEGHITDCAYIRPNYTPQKDKVFLSVAFCQYFWFMTDIALKKTERKRIENECKIMNLPLDQFINFINIASSNPQTIDKLRNCFPNMDVHALLTEILDVDFTKKIEIERNHALSILDKNTQIDIEAIKSYDLNTGYCQLVNNIYSYGIAFILLHELSHHALGHTKGINMDGYEEKADMNAFDSIFSDITDEERFTAHTGILFVFYALMQLCPDLPEDGIHPRTDLRLFTVYDIIKVENPKYTDIVIDLLNIWASNNRIPNYPTDLPYNEDSINKIKEFFANR